MSEVGELNLFKTNDLHFQKKNLCGMQVAYNKSVKSMSMFDRSVLNCTKNVLDYLSVRQRVVASNVANVNTPGYKTREVSFASVLESKNDALRLKMSRTHARHFPKGEHDSAGIETYYSYAPHNPKDSVNDVDLDKEMLKEAEIQTNYKLFSQILMRKYQSIKNTISGNV